MAIRSLAALWAAYTERDSFNQGSPPSSRRRDAGTVLLPPLRGEESIIGEIQHPIRDANFSNGLSHGLKIARQLSIFTPVCALVSPFRVPRCMQKIAIPNGMTIFWYTGRDSNPQPSEPESDALSIEPPVHSQAIISRFFSFVKRAFFNLFRVTCRKYVVFCKMVCYNHEKG